MQVHKTVGLGAPMIAVALALAGCGARSGAQEAPPATPVTVASPRVEDVAVWEELAGRFQAMQSVEIRPQITGRIVRAHFVDGQVVRQGDVLFTIDPTPAQASAERAKALAEEATAAQDLARSELARAERLRQLDAISEEEYDQRARGAERAKASAAAARAEARAAAVQLGYTTVRSPIAGRVSDRRVDPGNVVIADQSVLTSVVSSTPIHFEFSMDPRAASSIGRPGAGKTTVEVQARTEGEEGFPHRGKLDFLDNQVDQKTGVVRGRAVFDNADGRFTPGQFGRVRIARGRLDDAMTVPETAISSDQTRKFVLVVGDNNMVEPRPVELGPLVEGRRVVKGLDASTKVIVNGAGNVFPGMPVAPQQQASATPAPITPRGG